MKNIFSLTPSFGGVNADLIIRNMIFCVLYVCAILIVFSYILLPMILGFKSQYINERKEKIIYTEIKKDYDVSIQRLLDFINNNKGVFDKLNNKSSFDEAQTIIAQYLTIKDVKKTKESSNKNEQTTSFFYTFSAQTQHIENVWQLMNKIDTTNTSIVINPPIKIQRESMQSDIYDVTFSLEIKQNNYQVDERIQQILQTLPLPTN